jgi:recombination protein RecT
MSRDEVMRHKAVAKTKKFWDGPWEPSMWKKTAIHELEKWVPTSAEFIREKLRAAREVEAELAAAAPVSVAPAAPAGVNTETGEVVEGELLDENDLPVNEQWAGEPS